MIDAYLTGRLSPEDSAHFMQSLEQDPALKEEFLIQKDLVASLQTFRKQQLKARLDTIEVGTGYSFTSAAGFKIVAGVAFLALVGTATYFAYSELNAVESQQEMKAINLAEEGKFSFEEKSFPKKPETTAPQTEEIFSQEAAEASNEAKETTSALPVKKKESIAAENAPEKSNPAITKPLVSEPKNSNEAKPEVIKPDVLTYFDEKDALSSSPEVAAPADKLANIRSFDAKNIEVSTKTDERYPFHYSFYNNQLNIYGDFSQVPYEVLEVNSGFNTRYYLYHNKKYYELNPNQEKISRLKELKNEQIINELEITRAEKLNH